jgi:soluble cytochrome b562
MYGLVSALKARRTELERQLAECQAREDGLLKLLQYASYELQQYTEGFTVFWGSVDKALAMPFDSTALDEAIKQAKREVLLDAVDLVLFNNGREPVQDVLRRMVEELE